MIGHGFVNGMIGGRLPFSKPLSKLQTCLRSFISLIMHKQDNHVMEASLAKTPYNAVFGMEEKYAINRVTRGHSKKPFIWATCCLPVVPVPKHLSTRWPTHWQGYLELCLQALAEQ